ncbi:MAG: class I SAM-dependent rRNA methyltransferase [Planctomycetota bacterium]
MKLPDLVDRALEARAGLIEGLRAEDTDCYRVFHGSAEGRDGLTIDRYGTLVLAQTFREPLAESERAGLEGHLRSRIRDCVEVAFVDRTSSRHEEGPGVDHVCREAGTRFHIRARHRGKDPWLFLDLRAGRRKLRELCAGRSVLNLFAYTCAAGVAAAAAGASEVWNVDFSGSALEIGRRNAELNSISSDRIRFIQEDCLPVLRQLAGLPVKGRGSHRDFLRLEARTFDVVFLDPPAWSKGPFGAVDLERDYPALSKPALIATAPGGTVIATNHVASVDVDEWIGILRRSAEKSGRPLEHLETLAPDEDFPTRDGKAPLKVAVCRRSG